jgi:hypothetical protein
MLNQVALDKIHSALNDTKLVLSSLSGFVPEILWPVSLKPEKTFYEIAHQNVDIASQLEQLEKTVDLLVERKKCLIGNESIGNGSGRFLLYSPLHSTFDMLAAGETDGLFDEADAPPWATWLGFFNLSDVNDKKYATYLIAWIPKVIVPLANEGIDVCLGESLFWADDFDNVKSYGDNVLVFCQELVKIGQ